MDARGRIQLRQRELATLAAGAVLVVLAIFYAAIQGAASTETCGNLLLNGDEVTPLAPPPDASSDPRATTYFAVNNQREAVGAYAEQTAGSNAVGLDQIDSDHAVLRDDRGRFRLLDVPGALVTLAFDVNDRTDVVGQYIDAGAVPDAQGMLPAGTVHGFLSRGGEVTTIDVPGAALTQPLGINDGGDIVGAYIEAVPDPDPYAYNDTGRLRGFLLRDGVFTPIDVPGSEGTRVSGINDSAQMVGHYDDAEGGRRGFLLSDGRFTTIDRPGAPFTVASRIDDRGRIVGAYGDENEVNTHGFLWDGGSFTTIMVPGERTDTIAYDINDRGDIVVPADGTVLRQPEIACGRPTTSA
jgi:hypothetical protein